MCHAGACAQNGLRYSATNSGTALPLTNGNYASEAPRTLAHAGNEGIAVLTNLVSTGADPVRDQAG
jgi:hypothetical protein